MNITQTDTTFKSPPVIWICHPWGEPEDCTAPMIKFYIPINICPVYRFFMKLFFGFKFYMGKDHPKKLTHDRFLG